MKTKAPNAHGRILKDIKKLESLLCLQLPQGSYSRGLGWFDENDKRLNYPDEFSRKLIAVDG